MQARFQLLAEILQNPAVSAALNHAPVPEEMIHEILAYSTLAEEIADSLVLTLPQQPRTSDRWCFFCQDLCIDTDRINKKQQQLINIYIAKINKSALADSPSLDRDARKAQHDALLLQLLNLAHDLARTTAEENDTPGKFSTQSFFYRKVSLIIRKFFGEEGRRQLLLLQQMQTENDETLEIRVMDAMRIITMPAELCLPVMG